MTGFYYEVKFRNEMSTFLGENQYFFKKNRPIFCNQTGKVFEIYSFIYLVVNLMLHYSTYI